MEDSKVADNNNIGIINEITKEEINGVLSRYESAANGLLIPTVFSGIPGLAIGAGGLGLAGLAEVGVLAGFLNLSAFISPLLIASGVGAICLGIGIAFGVISYILKSKSEDKTDISKINEFEEIIKNTESLEHEIYNSLFSNIYSYITQKITGLIRNEYDNLLNIAYNLNLDYQTTFNRKGEQILKQVKQELPNFHNLDKFSILVLGKTGVGKTTLINAILNQEQSGTTVGLPMEMDQPQIKHFNRDLFPTLDIWDSRGLELANEYSIEENSQQVINFVKNGLKQEDLNKSMNFIHCIWYCITGTRIEKSELQYIKKLKRVYSSDKKLPIIFVYTQADKEEFIEPIKQTIIKELNEPNIHFIDVVAKEITFKLRKKNFTIGKRGLRKLMELSLNLSSQGFESYFYGNIHQQFKNTLLFFLTKKPVVNAIENIHKKINTMFEEKKSTKKFYETFSDLLFESLSCFYFDSYFYEENKPKNKSSFDSMKKQFINLYKNHRKDLNKLVDKEQFNSFLEIQMNNYYQKAFQKEISKIKDYEFMSCFNQMEQKEKINKELEPKRNKLKELFEKMIDNFVAHKEMFMTNLLISYLSQEFFKVLSKRLEKLGLASIENMKKKIDSDVQNIAKEIYNKLSLGIKIHFIPKDEEEEDDEEKI